MGTSLWSSWNWFLFLKSRFFLSLTLDPWSLSLSLSLLMNFWSSKGWSTHSKMMNKKHWKSGFQVDLSTSSFFPHFKKIRFSFLNFLSLFFLSSFLSLSLNKEECCCFWKENVLTGRCLFLVISFVKEWCCYICCRQRNRSKVQFLFLSLFPQTQHNSESIKIFFFSLSSSKFQGSTQQKKKVSFGICSLWISKFRYWYCKSRVCSV